MTIQHSRPPGGIPEQYVDSDPQESREWLESFGAVVDRVGPDRARYLMRELLRAAAQRDIGLPDVRQTDYINTIPPDREPDFPGDEDAERRLREFIRWNAAIMVHRGNRPGIGVGGHISTFASSASLYEVGFNHFFRGDDSGTGDQVFFQGHASPGIYSRAFLEGRISENQMNGFRQELSHPGGGLPSYPHPRLLPEFWQFPTVSMGLGPLTALYQARFNRYLHNRGIKDTSQQRVWAFLGDGESDEPETMGLLSLASREQLDNLVFVVNCNLQRLDGPVRGNGKIIQELESIYRGAGWNVIKVVWGRDWDPLLAHPDGQALVDLMNRTLDGDYQTYKAESGAFVREHFFNSDPKTAAMVAGMTDDQIWRLKRGGHDYRKLYAAYKAATESNGGRPTVILAKTVKGWTLGSHFEGRNSTHQMKKLTLADLKEFRDRLSIPIPDSQLDEKLPPYYHPGESDPVIQYMHERRRALDGYLPSRRNKSRALELPDSSNYKIMQQGSGNQEVATTMAFVRLLKELVKDKSIGPRWVPIIPDEARTFGMDAMFPVQKIYNPLGQQYMAVDRDMFLSYKEAVDGQLLHEGINEAGSAASFQVAGTSYSTHDEPMIPVYIFYSMFGFQRTGDSFWAAMDQMANGFVLGATAGRTTLNGEGLQHQDGHSLLLASTNPAVVAYDAAYAYELGHIVEDGLRRMYGENSEDVFYYLTVYNEPYVQPAQPADLDVQALLKGMYRLSSAEASGPVTQGAPRAQLLASGVAVPWALKAQQMLRDEWGVFADVWSVTSWNELRKDGLDCDQDNFVNPMGTKRVAFVTQCLQGAPGPAIAVSDWMRAVPDQIRDWVPTDYATLGADGHGLSDTRGALRRHFLIDAQSIVTRTLLSLADRGEVPREWVQQAIDRYKLLYVQAADAGNAGGEA